MRGYSLSSVLRTGLLAGGLALAASPLYAATEDHAPPIRGHLEMTKAYPDSQIQEMMPDQRAVVSFRVREDGRFENIRLLQSSGITAFDSQTLKSVQQASCMECAGHDYTVGYVYKQK